MTKISPNKHAIEAYGTTIMGLCTQIAYGGSQRGKKKPQYCGMVTAIMII